ncbi:hypothetical protein BGZ74_005603 [Mortierella antarctica]|nr:hypothetical protein BGZ74_005603 [Mortierella antarctica]KAG0359585.1 hypothetical protein BG005_000534 [Podila minutissima]
MKISIAALTVSLAVAASSVQAAVDQKYYRDCIKMGKPSSYCTKSRTPKTVFDPKCYRDCIKMGEPNSYCKRSCTN